MRQCILIKYLPTYIQMVKLMFAETRRWEDLTADFPPWNCYGACSIWTAEGRGGCDLGKVGRGGGGYTPKFFIKMYFKFRWTMIFFLRRKVPSLNLTSSRSADMLCKRRNPTSSFTNGKWQREDKTIDQFRYIKIQPNTIDLRTRLWE